MQIADTIIRLLGTVVWPAFLLATIFIFREPLTRLVDRVKSLSWGDKGAQFAAAVDEAEDKAGIEPSPEVAMVTERTKTAAAGKDPRGVILEAWLQVEQAIQEVVTARSLAHDYSRIQSRPFTALRLIQQGGFIDQKYVSLFQDLRALRNQAAHEPEFKPPTEAVLRYVELAEELTRELHRSAQAA